MLKAFFNQFRWYRALIGGTWRYVRLDLGDRPCYWIADLPNSNETVLDKEFWE